MFGWFLNKVASIGLAVFIAGLVVTGIVMSLLSKIPPVVWGFIGLLIVFVIVSNVVAKLWPVLERKQPTYVILDAQGNQTPVPAPVVEAPEPAPTVVSRPQAAYVPDVPSDAPTRIVSFGPAGTKAFPSS